MTTRTTMFNENFINDYYYTISIILCTLCGCVYNSGFTAKYYFRDLHGVLDTGLFVGIQRDILFVMFPLVSALILRFDKDGTNTKSMFDHLCGLFVFASVVILTIASESLLVMVGMYFLYTRLVLGVRSEDVPTIEFRCV